MIFPSNVPAYFCVVPIDMRRSFDSLSEIVRQSLGQEPRSGHLFVFRNKPEDCVKVLYWDRSGYAIWYKRLEKGIFKLPVAAGATLEITTSEFTMLLEGFDVAKLKKQNRWSEPTARV